MKWFYSFVVVLFGFFILIKFFFFSNKTVLAACVCRAGCLSNQVSCSNVGNCPESCCASSASGCPGGRVDPPYTRAPTNTPVPTGVRRDDCAYNTDCSCPPPRYPWCDTGANPNVCRCHVSGVTGVPCTGAWGACALYGREYCTKTRRCGDGWYETVPCTCGSGPPATIAPPNTPGPSPTPMPTFYPTSAVSGGLSVKNAGVCSSYPNAVITPVIRLVPQYPQGVTPICTSNLTTSTYSCNIGYNNRIASPPPLSQSFTLSSTTQSYGTGRWQVNNLCAGGNDSVRTITAGNVKTGWDIFYKILPWFKVQNGSFVSDSLYFSIPNTVTKFDSDDLGNRYLLDGETGVLTTTMVALPSPSLLPVSNKNWSRANYTRISTITANNFINYIKSRKKYKTIISLSDIAADGIYYYNGNLSISSSSLVPDYNIVLLVKGSATITANLTQTTAFALLATNEILIDPAVTQINGIFSATSFDSGGSTSGLKVVGNISATTLNNDRDRTDNSKPSIFILFDSGTYLKLLPYLSVSKYDWRQLQ